MKKGKISFKTKLDAVKAYQNKEGSLKSIANNYKVHESTFRKWVMIYESQGEEGLMPSKTHKYWDKEIKLNAVHEYITGNVSLRDICKKYKISTDTILLRWINVYNKDRKRLKTTKSGGKKLMIKARKTSFDERIKIVNFCVANRKNYALTMEKYKVSYQQIYSWVRKFEAKGIDGLIDNRGKSKPETELTELERLKLENKMLAARNAELEMENNIIKKLQEVERRYR